MADQTLIDSTYHCRRPVFWVAHLEVFVLQLPLWKKICQVAPFVTRFRQRLLVSPSDSSFQDFKTQWVYSKSGVFRDIIKWGSYDYVKTTSHQTTCDSNYFYSLVAKTIFFKRGPWPLFPLNTPRGFSCVTTFLNRSHALPSRWTHLRAQTSYFPFSPFLITTPQLFTARPKTPMHFVNYLIMHIHWTLTHGNIKVFCST